MDGHDVNDPSPVEASCSDGDRNRSDETKNCSVCGKTFAWQQKFARVWDEVRTCSAKCKKKERKVEHGAKGKEAQKRSKACAICNKEVSLAYRCKWRADQGDWQFVCRPCWPQVSGTGYLEKRERPTDQDQPPQEETTSSQSPLTGSDRNFPKRGPGLFSIAGNPHYKYGGTWKSVTGLTHAEIGVEDAELQTDEK